MNRAEQVERDGYAIVPAVVDELVVRDLLEQLGGSDLPRSRAGVRHMMEEVLHLAEKISGVECLVAQGGVVIMRPLVIHASSKATSERPRRVLHIEYASTEEIAEGLALTVA